MIFQGIEYDVRDVNDRLTLAEKLLTDLCRILTSEEARSEAIYASIHGFSVPEELASRNATSIATALEFLQQVKSG